MNIALIGPPGSGKGTIASILKEKREYNIITPGKILREKAKGNNEISKKINKILKKGNLVPPKITHKIIKERVKENNIFDGYPRSIKQAHFLDKELKLNKLFSLKLSEEKSIKRLKGRRICKKCGKIYHMKNNPPSKKNGKCEECNGELKRRKDDKPEIIKHRYQIYKEKTKPVIAHYKRKNIVKTIDASQKPKKIYSEIEQALSSTN